MWMMRSSVEYHKPWSLPALWTLLAATALVDDLSVSVLPRLALLLLTCGRISLL